MSSQSSSRTSAHASLPPSARVSAPVTGLWIASDSPREIDGPLVSPEPDAEQWLAGMDAAERASGDELSADGRYGLHGRIESQLQHGEPVEIVRTEGDWSLVHAVAQPHPDHPEGYPGWVVTAHLSVGSAKDSDGGPEAEADLPDLVDLAREHIGLRYLWGGITPQGYDCSGLVHHLLRRQGHTVARDAWAQAATLPEVALEDVQRGDLYFFAHPGKRIHHVGIVVSPGRMVHASETGKILVEEDLPEPRVATLVAAARPPR